VTLYIPTKEIGYLYLLYNLFINAMRMGWRLKKLCHGIRRGPAIIAIIMEMEKDAGAVQHPLTAGEGTGPPHG